MLQPRTKAPELSVPLTAGGRWTLGEQTPDSFTVIFFYRGKHCPICKGYLTEIQERVPDFAEIGAHPVAISMDGEERAKASEEEWGIDKLPLGYAMAEETAREWGLFISSKREGSQEPERFSEPGLFVLRPDGEIFFVAVQSAPFTRPPVDQLLKGLKFVMENDYPARGDLTQAA